MSRGALGEGAHEIERGDHAYRHAVVVDDDEMVDVGVREGLGALRKTCVRAHGLRRSGHRRLAVGREVAQRDDADRAMCFVEDRHGRDAELQDHSADES